MKIAIHPIQGTYDEAALRGAHFRIDAGLWAWRAGRHEALTNRRLRTVP